MWHVPPSLLCLAQCQLPPTLPNYLPLWAKIKAGSSFVIVPTFLPEALRRKGRAWVSSLLSKYFDPVSHIMHQSPQAEIKQVSAVSAPGPPLLCGLLILAGYQTAVAAWNQNFLWQTSSTEVTESLVLCPGCRAGALHHPASPLACYLEQTPPWVYTCFGFSCEEESL